MLPSNIRSAADYFGGMADSYDALIRRAVPRYDEMTSRLVDYLPPTASRVLELGCGTGNLTLMLAARFPEAELTLVDGAAEMLDLTRARLQAAYPGRRPDFQAIRFEEYRPAPGCFDVIASTISLHHVGDKAAVYRALRPALGPGGTFAFADQIRGATAAIHELNWRRWIEFCHEPGNCTPEELQSLLDHAAAHDHYDTLVDHFQMLQAAGFRNPDCIWRHWLWGIVAASA